MSAYTVHYTSEERLTEHMDSLTHALAHACAMSAAGRRSVEVRDEVDGYVWIIAAGRHDADV